MAANALLLSSVVLIPVFANLFKKFKGAYDLGYNIAGFRFVSGSTAKQLKCEIDVKFENKKSYNVEIESLSLAVGLDNENFVSTSLKEISIKNSNNSTVPALTIPSGTIVKTLPVEISTLGAAKILKAALSQNPPTSITFEGKVKIAGVKIPIKDSEPIDLTVIKNQIQDAVNETSDFFDDRFSKALVEHLNNLNQSHTIETNIKIYKRGLNKYIIVNQDNNDVLYRYSNLLNNFKVDYTSVSKLTFVETFTYSV